MTRRMDAAGPVDAQNAPTGPWKTAQTAVSHSAHTHRPFDRLTHEIPDTPEVMGTSNNPWRKPLWLALLSLYGLRYYLPNLKFARCVVPSTNFTTSCRQVFAHALSVFHT